MKLHLWNENEKPAQERTPVFPQQDANVLILLAVIPEIMWLLPVDSEYVGSSIELNTLLHCCALPR